MKNGRAPCPGCHFFDHTTQRGVKTKRLPFQHRRPVIGQCRDARIPVEQAIHIVRKQFIAVRERIGLRHIRSFPCAFEDIFLRLCRRILRICMVSVRRRICPVAPGRFRIGRLRCLIKFRVRPGLRRPVTFRVYRSVRRLLIRGSRRGDRRLSKRHVFRLRFIGRNLLPGGSVRVPLLNRFRRSVLLRQRIRLRFLERIPAHFLLRENVHRVILRKLRRKQFVLVRRGVSRVKPSNIHQPACQHHGKGNGKNGCPDIPALLLLSGSYVFLHYNNAPSRTIRFLRYFSLFSL